MLLVLIFRNSDHKKDEKYSKDNKRWKTVKKPKLNSTNYLVYVAYRMILTSQRIQKTDYHAKSWIVSFL